MKKTIIVDVDSTLTNSVETIFDIYKEQINPGDKDKECHNDYLWNLKGLIPEEYSKSAIELFDKQIFFDRLQLLPNALSVMKRLSRRYNIKICSVHNLETAHMKEDFLRKNLPFIDDIIFLPHTSNFDKSSVKGDIIIDDKVKCLKGDRDTKILFGNYKYNKLEYMTQEERKIYMFDSSIIRAENWKVVESILL